MIIHPAAHQLLQVVLLYQRHHHSLVERVSLRINGFLPKIQKDVCRVFLVVDMQEVCYFSVDPFLVFWLELLHFFDELDKRELSLQEAAIQAVSKVARYFLSPNCCFGVALSFDRILHLIHVNFATLGVVLRLHQSAIVLRALLLFLLFAPLLIRTPSRTAALIELDVLV